MRPLTGILIALGLMLAALTHATTGAARMDIDADGVPLPGDAAPMPVDQASSFAGVWVGAWGGWRKTVVIVEAIEDDGTARVVYAVAPNPHFGQDGSWSRRDATINGDTMTIEAERFRISLEVSSRGRLRAVFGDGLGFAILHRQPPEALIDRDRPINWTIGAQEFIETDLVEDGGDIRLETIVFTPPGDGPFPLAIVNHGSTGMGTDPAIFTDTWTSPWLADELNARGWIVAMPQRRGRGQSDGLYDEGFAQNRAEGYTCDPERSLAGADRALEDLDAAMRSLRARPDVSDAPVLLVGQSRGGALSVAFAGRHPDRVAGVINFVGGWLGEGCDSAEEVNQSLFKRGASYPKSMLWLYGVDDLFYAIPHSRKNYTAFVDAGGTGDFVEVTVAGENNGHWVMSIPPLWSAPVTRYLETIEAGRDE